MNMYLFQRIEEVMLTYQDTRRNIAEFVLNERDKVLKMSLQEIADCTYTSKATLVRFAKTLGYSGWREFMREFMEESVYQETHYTSINPNFPFEEGDSVKQIIHNVSSLHMESILDTMDTLDSSEVEKAVDRMISARRIVLFGLDPNSFFADIFKWKMLSIGQVVTVAKTGEAGMLAHAMTDEDCGIIISYSGNNPQKEPLMHLDLLKQNKVKLIGITGGGNNYIRERVDCVLSISSRERLYTKISNFSTEESILIILNVLFSCYFARNYEKNLRYKTENSRTLEISREASLKEMKEN
jgi:DNA-binding MurR/RpiR family transcriptional regulator